MNRGVYKEIIKYDALWNTYSQIFTVNKLIDKLPFYCIIIIVYLIQRVISDYIKLKVFY